MLRTLSNGMEVLPDPPKRESLMRQSQLKDLFYPGTRVHRLAERERFEVITLVPAFQQYIETHQESLHGFENAMIGFGNLNVRGHLTAGEHLTKYFCAHPSRTGAPG